MEELIKKMEAILSAKGSTIDHLNEAETSLYKRGFRWGIDVVKLHNQLLIDRHNELEQAGAETSEGLEL